MITSFTDVGKIPKDCDQLTIGLNQLIRPDLAAREVLFEGLMKKILCYEWGQSRSPLSVQIQKVHLFQESCQA